MPGVTTGADLLGQILFDSGDVVLVPAPYYFRFVNDFGERGLVKIGVVLALSKCGTRTELCVERFEEAYQNAIKEVIVNFFSLFLNFSFRDDMSALLH